MKRNSLVCPYAGSPSPLTPAGSCRYDSSLGNSGIKFIVFNMCFLS